MQTDRDGASPLIERALETLQDERRTCVRRLQEMLESDGEQREVEGYLRRIEDINAALVRLAGTHMLHRSMDGVGSRL